MNLLKDIKRNAGNQAAIVSPREAIEDWQDELAVAAQTYNAKAIYSTQ